MTNQDQDTSNEKLKKLISSGGEIAGAAVGGALGSLLAGPIGGAAGSAAGSAAGALAADVIKKIGTEVATRVLSEREQVRVGATIALASEIVRNRTQRGENLRNDDFFEKKHNGRSDAEEVCEGVLLKSQKEPEEKKIRLLAYLIGNIAFDKEISAQLAHQIIKAAESLTYRQLCILKLISVKEDYKLREGDFRNYGNFPKSLYEILYECYDLYNRGYISFGGDVAFGPTDVNPSKMNIQGIGADLYYQMGLATIETSDIISISQVLGKSS